MLIVEGTIRVSDVGAARPIMTRMIEASRAEPSCIEYAYAFDLLDPTLVRISERWTTRAALRSSCGVRSPAPKLSRRIIECSSSFFELILRC